MAILTYPLNGVLYDAEDAETYLCTRTSGVFASDGHFPASVTGQREVTIGPGLAWMQNEEFHGKAIYNPENVALTIAEADAYQIRIDRIVLRFDKLLNLTQLMVLEGTPSSNPQPPAITRDSLTYDLGLYTVTVKNSTVSLSEADVASTMLDESVCGIMEDAVTSIPTQELYDQWYSWFADIQTDTEEFENQFNVWFQQIKDQSEAYMAETEKELDEWKETQQKDFDEWFDNLQYVLDGDVAGKLEVEIENAQDTADTAMEQLVTGWVEGFVTDEYDGSEYAILADDSDENYAITISRPICNCDDKTDTSADLITDEFSKSKSYSAGDYCIYNNMLFVFTADHHGDWDYADVSNTTVGEELQAKEAEIEKNASEIERNASDISTVKSGLTDGSVTKVGTSTIGGSSSPIYLSSGTPTACTRSIPAMEGGRLNIDATANSVTTVHVTFSSSFSSAPIILVSLVSTSTSATIGSLTIATGDESRTGFDVSVFNDTSSSRSPSCRWFAISLSGTNALASPQSIPDDDGDTVIAPGPEIIEPDDDGTDNDDGTVVAPGPVETED